MTSFSALVSGTFPLFLKPIAAEFDWGRAVVSGVLTTAGILYAIANPIIGRGVDRWGARRFVLPGIVAYSLSVMGASRLSGAPVKAYLLFALIGITSADSADSSRSSKSSPPPSTATGLMLALVIGAAGTVGTAAGIPLARLAILHYGWRTAYLLMGAAIFVLSFPMMLAFLREPEHEDVPGAPVHRPRGGTVVLPGKTALQAIGTGAFWSILLSILSMSVALYAFRAHSVAWLTDRGIPPGELPHRSFGHGASRPDRPDRFGLVPRPRANAEGCGSFLPRRGIFRAAA